MTTANEPSVAELPMCACDELYASHHPDCPVRAVITRLERRCAEMEKALRQVPRYDLDGACEGESGYCREGLARDDNGDWVLYSAVAALLPPERANEGKAGG